MLLLSLSKRKKGVLEIQSKPKIPAEIRDQMGLKKNNNIVSTLKKLFKLHLIRCLNPDSRIGKLYGLTKRGQQLRCQLLTARNIPYYYTEPADIDWKLYGWVCCGRQRKAILKAMNYPMPLKYIREQAKNHNTLISRTNANDVLQLFVAKNIAAKTKNGNRSIFRLTQPGVKIREQLLIR